MKSTFFCIDGHTCGNPVRLVAGGAPPLGRGSLVDKWQRFMQEYDWIRRALMFEPRGHDMMSGSLLYPPDEAAHDAAVIFIETSGCLPMCGHGTIGTVTLGVEAGLLRPRTPGMVLLETPAGLVTAHYRQEGDKVRSVRLANVASFLAAQDLELECPRLGTLRVDVAYGGNFYAIVDPQPGFAGLEHITAEELIPLSRALRQQVNERYSFVHPLQDNIRGVHHIMWTGKPLDPAATARNAVFYGDKAIDRSPCGTGTSARMAQWHARGRLMPGRDFIHESIIGSQFRGRIEGLTDVGGRPAIYPSIEGWARAYGHNTITVDTGDDPYALGFQVR